jgi:hypothetical protein
MDRLFDASSRACERRTILRFGRSCVSPCLVVALLLSTGCDTDPTPRGADPPDGSHFDVETPFDGGTDADSLDHEGAPEPPPPPPLSPCAPAVCAPGGVCVPPNDRTGAAATCACDEGWVATAVGCESAIDCLDPHHASEPGCAPSACVAPQPLAIGHVRVGFVLPFFHANELHLRATDATGAWTPWRRGDVLSVAAHLGASVRVQARPWDNPCDAATLTQDLVVLPTWPPEAGTSGSTAVAMDDPSIVAWATHVVDMEWGEGTEDPWRDLTQVLGPAQGSISSVASLGEGGVLTLGFGGLLFDGPGPDLVVFENAFDDSFLELAFVEVSSDAVHWARFDAIYEGPVGPDPFLVQSPRGLYGFAGLYRRGWGVPFDLAHLASHPLVLAGHVDLHAIELVRIVDIVGDGGTVDSLGAPIYDPWPTRESAGFDLDAVGVFHLRP